MGSLRFRVLAFLCFSFSLVALSYFARSLFTPETGLVGYYPEVAMEGQRVVFSPSTPFSAAAAGGLVADRDGIVAVNGIPVANSRDLLRAVSSIRGFEPFPVVVERDGVLRDLVLAPDLRPTRIDWFFILAFCMALGVTAFVLTWRLPQEESTLPLVLSALLSLVFTCVTPFAYEGAVSNALFNLGNIGSWLLVFFAMLFPWKRGSASLRRVVIGLVLLAFACFVVVRVALFVRWTATGEESLLLQYKMVGQVGNVSDGIAYAVLVALLGSAYLRTRLPRDRKMLQWMLAGALIAFPPYFFFDQLPLILGGEARHVGLGSLAQLFLSVLPLCLLVGLTQHRALNLRRFMIRYGTYGTLALITAAMFAGIYLPLKGYIQATYRLSDPLPELLASGVILLAVALLRVPLEMLFQVKVRRAPGDLLPAGDTGLRLIIEELGRDGARHWRTQRLTELRAVLRGVVRSLQEPARRVSAGLALTGDQEQTDAGARINEFLRTLESLCGNAAGIAGTATPQAVAESAIRQVSTLFPVTEFQLTGYGDGRFACFARETVDAVSAALCNAAEAQEGRHMPVLVRTARDGTRVLIEVEDRGPGIDARARRRLFSPFFTTKPGHQGLGLYVARMIVERNEGNIEITPSENGGTIVRFAFPRDEHDVAFAREGK